MYHIQQNSYTFFHYKNLTTRNLTCFHSSFRGVFPNQNVSTAQEVMSYNELGSCSLFGTVSTIVLGTVPDGSYGIACGSSCALLSNRDAKPTS